MISRDSLDAHPLYRQIVAAPRDDLPRLALADAIESAAPQRARYIRSEIALAQEECRAIVAGSDVPLEHDAAVKASAKIGEANYDQWRTDDIGLTAGSYRGFGEYISVTASTPSADIEELFHTFPILHAFIGVPHGNALPSHLGERIDGLASLWLRGADDNMMAQLVRDDRLRTLRRFKVQGRMSMRAVELLCEAGLPELEELEIWGGTITNPCDIAASDDWAARNPRAYAIMSRAGAELEKRHGYRKFLHAASRFSVYPCSPAALDILPPLPPDRFVRPREWG